MKTGLESAHEAQLLVVEGQQVENLVHGKSEDEKIDTHGAAELPDFEDGKIDQGFFGEQFTDAIGQEAGGTDDGKLDDQDGLEPAVFLALGQKGQQGDGGGGNKKEAVASAKKYFGFFVLLSNETMDAQKALQIYRNKDVVEKAFGNLKERLSMRRLLVSSEQSLEGKLFVAFIALIFLSYIKKKMQEHNLYKKYTLQTLLDELDVIECFEYPGKKLQVGEVLQKQKEIYEALGVVAPS
jgi:hypothetical protein